MQDRNFRPMVAHLTRGILLWGVLAAIVVSGIQGWRAKAAAEAEIRLALHRQVAAMTDSMTLAIWYLEMRLVRAQLEAGLSVPGVSCLRVFDRSGAGRAPFEKAGDEIQCAKPASGSFDLLLNTTAHTPADKWFRGRGASIGRLEFVEDGAAITRLAFSAAAQAMWISMSTTIAILVGTVLLMRAYLQRPLRHIADQLEGFDAKATGQPVHVPRPARRWHDEIDLVTSALGSMQERIAAHVQELDSKVAERTEQLQQALDTVKSLATTDVLTACANRLAFSQRYPEAVAHAERYGRPLSVVFCDVDRFKSINDRFGHPVGDRVLANMGGILRQALRASSDWVARYGGEEFMLVLPETPLSQALEVAERVRQLVLEQAAVEVNGQLISVTASFGVGELQAGETGEGLLKRADELLYAAKHDGRNCVRPALTVPA